MLRVTLLVSTLLALASAQTPTVKIFLPTAEPSATYIASVVNALQYETTFVVHCTSDGPCQTPGPFTLTHAASSIEFNVDRQDKTTSVDKGATTTIVKET